MTLLVPDDSLQHFSVLKNIFSNSKNKTFFIWDHCCHLMLCLHLMEPNSLLQVDVRLKVKAGVLEAGAV